MGVAEPGPELSEELKALDSDSRSLTSALAQTNFLPEDFPKKQCELICSALSGLRHGSLEGSAIALEHSIVRLSEIRRTQFQILDEGESLESFEDDGYPFLARGDALDLRFAAVITSASTALDAYRAQARKSQESTSEEEYLRSLDRIETQGRDLEKTIRDFDELSKLAGAERSDSGEVAELAIRAADARNSTISTAVEASSQVVIRGWLKRLVQHTRTSVVALRTSIRVLEKAGGVAAEFYRRAQKTLSRAKDGTIDEVLDWLRFLDAQLGRAQRGLDGVLSEETQSTTGVVKRFGGSYVVMTADRSMIPLSIDAIAKRPSEGYVVNAKVTTSGGASTVIDWEHDFTMIYMRDAGFIPNEDAREVILDRCLTFMRHRLPRPAKATAVKKALRRLEVAPPNFWNQLGFDSFESFLSASTRIEKLEDYGGYTDAIVLRGEAPPRIERENFLEWASNQLSKTPHGQDLHALHLLAQTHFGVSGIPVRYALRLKKFSAVFDGDDRFVVSGGKVALSSSVPST